MSLEKFSLNKKDTALLVIDIQERLVKAMNEKIVENVIKNTGILIELSKVLGMPFLVTEQYRKGLGPTVEAISNRLGDSVVPEKLYFDCVKDDTIKKKIMDLNKKNIILTGIEAHVCVFQTAISLLTEGFNVVVASDAVSSRRKHDWKFSLKALDKSGAFIYPTETIAFLLLEKAGTPEFKKMAPMFK